MDRGKARITAVVLIGIGDIRSHGRQTDKDIDADMLYVIYVYAICICCACVCVSYLSPMKGSRSNNILGAMTTLSI